MHYEVQSTQSRRQLTLPRTAPNYPYGEVSLMAGRAEAACGVVCAVGSARGHPWFFSLPHARSALIATGPVLVTQTSETAGERTRNGFRVTRTEALRQRLSEDIIRGALEPGSPLDEADLAKRFGVSRTPVREAIRNLAASGLVETRPHRGAVVALPTLSRLMDMFKAMAELEALCAGLAAEEMSPAERTKLQKLHDEMAGLVAADDAARYRDRNERFHAMIYAGTHNSYLAEITLLTRARVSPFRRAQFGQPGRVAESHREHSLVVDAIMARDRAAATEHMRLHIDIVRDAYQKLQGR